MASIKAEVKRGLLQYIADGVSMGTLNDDLGLQLASPITTLDDGLKWFQRFVFVGIQSGKTSTGSSGIGHSAQFDKWILARPYSPEELFGAVQELREVYADAITALTAAGLQSITDPQILSSMMADDRLQTVKRQLTDYSTLRWPVGRIS